MPSSRIVLEDVTGAEAPPGKPGPLHDAHLGLVQRLGFGFALQGNVLIVGADFGDNAVQVQRAVVIHGQDDRGLAGMGLDLGSFLK